MHGRLVPQALTAKNGPVCHNSGLHTLGHPAATACRRRLPTLARAGTVGHTLLIGTPDRDTTWLRPSRPVLASRAEGPRQPRVADPDKAHPLVTHPYRKRRPSVHRRLVLPGGSHAPGHRPSAGAGLGR